MDLWVREAPALSKYGSEAPSNPTFRPCAARGESSRAPGKSSGADGFLKIGRTRRRGPSTSGGTTRRAAKMVIVDADHLPIIEDFHQTGR